MNSTLRLGILCSLIGSPLLAQSDEWMVSAIDNFITGTGNGGLWQVDAAQTTATLLGGQTSNMRGANCVAVDESGLAYYGTINSGSISIRTPGRSSRWCWRRAAWSRSTR